MFNCNCNQIISPDGTLNASRINETTDNEAHRIFLNPTLLMLNILFLFLLKAGKRLVLFKIRLSII
jgi:2-polyprenyl-3-methyl-5-hydroxy-6-metoxy-1,4-benzoquinol methylase